MKLWLSNNLFHAVYGKMDYLKDYNDNTIPNKENIALISIHDPDRMVHPDIKLEGFADVKQIQFWDIEESFGNYKTISDEQGKELRDFINKNKDRRFIVHCAAGQSRSAGVACAIECIANFNGVDYHYKTGSSDVKAHERYSPNYTVYDKIIKIETDFS